MSKKEKTKDYVNGWAYGKQEVCRELLIELSPRGNGPIWDGLKFTEGEYHKFILMYIQELQNKVSKLESNLRVSERLVKTLSQTTID